MTNQERRLLVAAWCIASTALAAIESLHAELPQEAADMVEKAGSMLDASCDDRWCVQDLVRPPSEDGLVRVSLDEGAEAPTRAYPTDAGLDLRAMEACSVPAHGSREVLTGTHVQLPAGHCGIVMGRSGLNINHAVAVVPLVVDEGFTGQIKQRVYNFSDQAYRIERGDRVAQMVIVPCACPEPVVVDTVDGGERGEGGYGSTGR